MLKSFFRTFSLGKAAAFLALTTALSYILGMFRDIILADYFGASEQMDAYNASFLVPDAIYNFFVAGAILAAFIPIYSDYQKKDEEEAGKLSSAFLILSSLVIIFASIICYFLMPTIITGYFKGASAEKISDIISLSRLLLLSPLLLSLSNTLGNVLMAKKHFFSYALSPIFYNLGIIGGIIFLSDKFGILGAGYGAIFGFFLHFIIRLFEISSFSLRWKFVFWHPAMKKIFILMLPKTIGLLSWQICLWSVNYIGDVFLAEGSVSAFYYAKNLQSLPVNIFGISLATAIFPFLSENVTLGNKESLVKSFNQSLRQVLFFTLPAALGLYLLARQIVDLIYLRGSFSEIDAALVSGILLCFIVSIPLEAMIYLASKTFYAFKNTIIPVISALILMITMVVGSYFYAPIFGAKGFAIFFSFGCLLQAIFLFIFLGEKLKGFSFRVFFLSLFKIGLSLSFMALIIFALSFLSLSGGKLLLLQIFFGIICYFAVAYLLKAEEISGIKFFLNALRKKS